MTTNNQGEATPKDLQQLLDKYISSLIKEKGFLDFIETKYCLEALIYFSDARAIGDASEVDALNLKAYFAYLDDHCPGNNKTYCYRVKVHLGFAQSFFNWLLASKYIDKNPFDENHF